MKNKSIKKVLGGVLLLVLMFSLVGSALAITGSIGNARMILRAEAGDQIEKYITVKNVNDVDLEIELFASGDLEEEIEIKDQKFILSAGDEKKAYFIIDVKESGTFETKMNVKFTPTDDGNGVGLSSTVIVIASGEGEGDSETDSDDNTGVGVGTGRVIDDSEKSDSKMSLSLVIAIVVTIILLVVFIGLIANMMTKGKKEEAETKPKKSALEQ